MCTNNKEFIIIYLGFFIFFVLFFFFCGFKHIRELSSILHYINAIDNYSYRNSAEVQHVNVNAVPIEMFLGSLSATVTSRHLCKFTESQNACIFVNIFK